MSNQDRRQELLTTLGKQLESNLGQPLFVATQTTMFQAFFGITARPSGSEVQFNIIAGPGIQLGAGDATGKTTPRAPVVDIGPVNLVMGPFNLGTVEAVITTDLNASTATASLTVALAGGLPSGTFSVEVGSWAVSSSASR